MESLLHNSLQFPSIIWTFCLSLALLYWVATMAGIFDIDSFGGGEGVHGDLGIDGHGMDGGHLADGSSWLSRTGLFRVPLTITLSVYFLLNWFLCHLLLPMGRPLFEDLPFSGFWPFLVFVILAMITLPISAILVLPLQNLFREEKQIKRKDFIGREIEITTGSVDEHFGQANLHDGGAGLLIQVRCADTEASLKKGDRAVVLSYDEESESYQIAPFSS